MTQDQLFAMLSDFNSRLTRLEQHVADLQQFIWDEPLVSLDDTSVNPLDENEKIQILKEQLAAVNLEISNLQAPGENVIQFRRA